MELSASGLRTDQLEWMMRRIEAYATSCNNLCRSAIDCLGVFAADTIPSRATLERHRARLQSRSGSKSLVCFIANTDPAKKGGSHWVAFVVFASRPTVVEYFDSFGLALETYSELHSACTRFGYMRSASTIRCANTSSAIRYD